MASEAVPTQINTIGNVDTHIMKTGYFVRSRDHLASTSQGMACGRARVSRRGGETQCEEHASDRLTIVKSVSTVSGEEDRYFA